MSDKTEIDDNQDWQGLFSARDAELAALYPDLFALGERQLEERWEQEYESMRLLQDADDARAEIWLEGQYETHYERQASAWETIADERGAAEADAWMRLHYPGYRAHLIGSSVDVSADLVVDPNSAGLPGIIFTEPPLPVVETTQSVSVQPQVEDWRARRDHTFKESFHRLVETERTAGSEPKTVEDWNGHTLHGQRTDNGFGQLSQNDVRPFKPELDPNSWSTGVIDEYGSLAAFDLNWDHRPLLTDYHVDVLEDVETSGQAVYNVAIIQERFPDPSNPISEQASGTTTSVIGRYSTFNAATEIQTGLNAVRSGVFDLLGKDESDVTARSQANALMATTAYGIATSNGEVDPRSLFGRFFEFPDPAFDERTPAQDILADIETSLYAEQIEIPAEADQSGPELDL